jgi:Na+-translocating ferredoxin:NAD+ oxidoreductase RnfA subunit
LLLLLLSAVLVNSLGLRAPGAAARTSRDMFRIAQLLGAATVVLVAIVALFAQALKAWPQTAILDLPAIVLVATGLAGVADRYLRARSEIYASAPRIAVLLLASNSISPGVVLLRTTYAANFGDALLLGLGAGVVFAAGLLAFESLRERVEQADTPPIFRPVPLLLFTAGCVSLALMGLIGIARS